jgi:hypothetical protein
LLSHPTHAVAKRVLKGFGTIISFDILEDAEVADKVCQNVQLICHATSLGAVESTMERTAAIPGQEHLPPTLLRLSVGIEDAEDLWDDLDAAIHSGTSSELFASNKQMNLAIADTIFDEFPDLVLGVVIRCNQVHTKILS